jgi:hypothetical protein
MNHHRAPRAPWGKFPLSELTVLGALGCATLGLLTWGTPRSAWAFLAATTLGCLAGLEVAIREHLTGHRRRTALLAATAAAIVSAAAVRLRLSPVVALLAALTAGAIAPPLLQRTFARRAQRGRPHASRAQPRGSSRAPS